MEEENHSPAEQRDWWSDTKRKAERFTALVDSGDIHCLMIGAAGVGKTANFLYPNIEYACASGMSFLTTDTKGDLFETMLELRKVLRI